MSVLGTIRISCLTYESIIRPTFLLRAETEVSREERAVEICHAIVISFVFI